MPASRGTASQDLVAELEAARDALRSLKRELEAETRERQNAERALLESEQKLYTLFHDAPVGIAQTDPHDGRFLVVNPRFCAMTGYDEAELLGRPFPEITHPEDRSSLAGFFRMGSGEIPGYQTEIRYLRRDGSTMWGDVKVILVRDAGGQPLHALKVVSDITEQRNAEIRAQETLEAASRLQRLQTANELATLLAHELNQPLAAIANYAEAGQLLLRHAPLEQDKLTRNLEQISQQSLRAGDAIKHLRAFVGRGRIDPVPLDLNAVVRDTGTLMVPKAHSRGIGLAIELDPTLPRVMGVEVHIEQVLLNLVRNAIDAIRDARMKRGTITVTTWQQAGMAQVSVRDSGPGIDAEHADKVFEPLASHKEYGLGVGLRISRSLIEAHGGKLWVEPQRPGGIFHFILPFAP